MRWYEGLYVGEKAKKSRYSIIQSVRKRKTAGYFILTLPAGKGNLLDIYPDFILKQPYYEKQDLLIVGIASDFEDAALLAGRIAENAYKKTGGFDVPGFLLREAGEDGEEKNKGVPECSI